VGPLAFVLMISMLREGYEDYVKLFLVRRGIQKIGKLILAPLRFFVMENLKKFSGIKSWSGTM
jgi:hypothetical protein